MPTDKIHWTQKELPDWIPYVILFLIFYIFYLYQGIEITLILLGVMIITQLYNIKYLISKTNAKN